MLNKFLLICMVLSLSITMVSCGKSSKTSTDDTIESVDDETDTSSEEDTTTPEDTTETDDGNKSGDNFGGTTTLIEPDDSSDDTTTGISDGGTPTSGDPSPGGDTTESLTPVSDDQKRISGNLENTDLNVKITINGQEYPLGPDAGDNNFEFIVDKDTPIDLIVTSLDDNQICYIKNPVHFEDITVDGLKVTCIDDITVGEVINLYDNAFIDCLRSVYSPYLLSTRVSAVTNLHCSSETFDSAQGLHHFINVEKIYFGQNTKTYTNPNSSNNFRYVLDTNQETGILALDLSNNVNLKDIWLNQIHGITNIDFSKNILLEKFQTNLVFLETFDSSNIQNLKNLKSVDISASNITKLDFSNNPNVSRLSLEYNYAGIPYHPTNNPDAFKFARPENLKILHLFYTELKHIDLSIFTNLEIVDLSYSPMINSYESGNSTIDLSQNTKLTHFRARGSLSFTYDFTNLAELKELDIGGSSLTSLDISNNKKLYKLRIDNGFTSDTPIVYAADGYMPHTIIQ